MRSVHVLSAASIALLIALPALAQELKAPVDLFGQPKQAPKPPAVDWNWRPPAESAPAKPSVVCGMTVIPADPTVDPKMRVAPSDTRTAYAMRVVPPTVCAPK